MQSRAVRNPFAGYVCERAPVQQMRLGIEYIIEQRALYRPELAERLAYTAFAAVRGDIEYTIKIALICQYARDLIAVEIYNIRINILHPHPP